MTSRELRQHWREEISNARVLGEGMLVPTGGAMDQLMDIVQDADNYEAVSEFADGVVRRYRTLREYTDAIENTWHWRLRCWFIDGWNDIRTLAKDLAP